jgi:ribonuclease HI
MMRDTQQFFDTDGSTNPKSRACNSGAGIVLTDPQHKVLWSGGMVVRADGNNFIPELAAASCVIKALPKDKSLTLRIDSLATIGALKHILVSERKRIRAPGRSWLDFCRASLLEKRVQIGFEHISSHKGTYTAEQKGNDLADKIANEFRTVGENKFSPPAPYLSLGEESIVLQCADKIIQNDPRKFLKSLEMEKMIEHWKKAPKQVEWYLKYPRQVLKQSKRIWEKAIRIGNGELWLSNILVFVNGSHPITEPFTTEASNFKAVNYV